MINIARADDRERHKLVAAFATVANKEAFLRRHASYRLGTVSLTTI